VTYVSIIVLNVMVLITVLLVWMDSLVTGIILNVQTVVMLLLKSNKTEHVLNYVCFQIVKPVII